MARWVWASLRWGSDTILTSTLPGISVKGEVFVCENLFDEGKRVIRPLPTGGLKKYHHSKQENSHDAYNEKETYKYSAQP